MKSTKKIGVIGGTGWQGSAIVQQALVSGFFQEKQLCLSSRSGSRKGFEKWPGVLITTDNQQLVEQSDVIILSVRPQQFLELHLDLSSKLVISIMAGVSIEKICALTQATDVVRSMPNVAAKEGLSYTAWTATKKVTDKKWLQNFFESFGAADEFDSEDKINFATALTGGGTGLVAFYQQCMIETAVEHGFTDVQAEKAVKQLFYGSGVLYSGDQVSIKGVVKEFVDYAGTTAAGILGLKEAGLKNVIKKGVEAAYKKASGDMSVE